MSSTKGNSVKRIMLILAIVIELAGVVVIAKAAGRETSPAAGIILLSVGVVLMVVAIARRSS